MTRGLTIMLVRSAGQAPLTLRLSTWSMLGLAVLSIALIGACVWAGWNIGELTFAL
jgi:hypothetical protein